MIFDSHAHYNDAAFDEDREELLNSLRDHGICGVTNIGDSIESSARTYELAKEYSFIYGAVGVHPSEVEGVTPEDIEGLRAYTEDPKIVAIGEIGLDYHYPEPDCELQKAMFRRQIELALSCNLPIVIHSRDAAKDTMDILDEYPISEIGGVMHCYSYSPELACEVVKRGLYIGIGGVLTFKNAKKLIATAEVIPLERIVLETDCPYLAPEPNRGRRNSSLNLPYVVKRLAEIKEVTPEEVARITCKNACNLYHIDMEQWM